MVPPIMIAEYMMKIPNGVPLAWHWFKGTWDGSDESGHISALRAKLLDPAAGISFAAIAEGIFLLDAYALPAAHIHRQLLSIYHLANLMVYPLSYFSSGDIKEHCEDFYAQWRTHYQTFSAVVRDTRKIMTPVSLPGGSPLVKPIIIEVPVDKRAVKVKPKQPLPDTLAQQQSFLRENMPDVFNLLSVGFYIARCAQAVDAQDLSGYDKAKALLLDVGGKVYQWYEGKSIQFDDDQANATATILLTALLTPQANPAPAMGYQFNPRRNKKLIPKDMKKKVHPIPQGALLPDHSGMLIPNKALWLSPIKRGIYP